MAATVTLLWLIFANSGIALAADDAPANDGASSREVTKETSSRQELPNKMVVARVNGAEITMDSLVKMMNRISAKIKNGADREVVQQQALDRLILQNLALKKALKDGLAADKKNVTAALANLKKNLGGEEEYKNFLVKEQVTEEDLQSQIFRSLTLELAYAREVYNKVTIPEEAVKKEYEKEKARYVTPEKMRVVDVLFLQQGEIKTVHKTANKVLKKIREDKEQNPWNLSLDGTFIVRAIDLNGDKDGSLYQAAKKLQVGELSGVINTSESLHIIKMKEYTPERQMTLEEVRGNIENALRVPAQDRRLREWEQELRKEASIEIVWSELALKK
jgi:parvulin-like peptidyl-prolyl isomerase